MKENIIASVRWARELFSSTSNRKNILGMIFSRQAAKTNSTGSMQMKAALSRLKFHALDNATPIDKICRFKQNDDGLILNLAKDSVNVS